MSRFLLLPLLSLCCLFGCRDEGRRNQHVDVVKDIPSFPSSFINGFKCGEMIRITNRLRAMGREQALVVLREYIQSKNAEPAVVMYICRLLFENPRAWSSLELGAASPPIKAEVAWEYPLFPIAISENVPFLLVWYEYEGSQKPAWECLKLCEELTLVKSDYATSGFEEAGQRLVKSESFRRLYRKSSDADWMAELIMKQASEK